MEFRSTVAIASRDSDREIEALLDAFRSTHRAPAPSWGSAPSSRWSGGDIDTMAAGGVVDVTFAV